MPKPKSFVLLRSRGRDIVDPTQEWETWFDMEMECPTCLHPGTSWQENPKPIDVVITEIPIKPISWSGTFIKIIHSDLFNILHPFLHRVLIGRCDLKTKRGLEPTGHVSICAANKDILEAYRARLCYHRECPTCGNITNQQYAVDDGAILRRSLDDRLIYLDCRTQLLVETQLAKSLGLKERFPDLRFIKIPVVEEPLDNEVLPGDPEWDGKIKPRKPIPIVPDEQPGESKQNPEV